MVTKREVAIRNELVRAEEAIGPNNPRCPPSMAYLCLVIDAERARADALEANERLRKAGED